ncbi:MAG: CAP domain-containing protein [Bacillota bacterium]|nr:CAP domain-containing protein [Bacillota bacterium]
MQSKKVKLAVTTIFMAFLTACANNNNDISGPRTVSTGDLKHPIQNNVSNPNTNQNGSVRHPNGINVNPLFTANEIQPMNNGYITIDPNSYSTSTPSHQYPHTRIVNNGQYWYYEFHYGMTPSQNGAIVVPPRQNRITAPAPNRQSPATRVNPPAQQPNTNAAAGNSQMAQQVIELTNNERRKNGLAPLSADPSLSRVAQTKTNDMNSKHYFSHTSPTYGSPFDMMRDFGVTYKAAGENIAMGQTTAQQVVTSWMNSEGHRKNILSPNYTSIGVGYTSNGNYWSQMFIGK